MSRLHQPCKLEKLAIDVLCRQVKALSYKLLNIDNVYVCIAGLKKTLRFRHVLTHFKFFRNTAEGISLPFNPDQHEEESLRICSELECVLNEYTNHFVAEELTMRLLDTVCEVLDEKWRILDASWGRTVLQYLINAVIRPSVTHLKLRHHLHYVGPMICKKLVGLENLQHLDMSYGSEISDAHMLVGVLDSHMEQLIIDAVKSLPNLRTFRFPCNSTDDIVTAIAQNCPLLQCLDVECSKITMKSLEHVLNLKHLVELNVVRSWLSEEEYSTALRTMTDNGIKLKKIGMSCVTLLSIDILSNDFPQLVCVQLFIFTCDLSVLSQLKNLQELKLHFGQFSNVRQLIESVGYRFTKLELAQIKDVDVKLIGQYCSELISLRLRRCPTLPLEEITEPLPGFANLHNVYLYTKSDSELIVYILSQCINARSVEVHSKFGISENCIENFLKKNPFEHLTYLRLETGQIFPHYCVFRLFSHCLKLVTLKGLTSWRVASVDVLQQLLAEEFPGVQLI